MSDKEKLDQAARFVTQHVEKVKNGIGGVIGYRLILTMAETESLWKILEPDKEPLHCPDCSKPLKPKKSMGGLMACFCLWGGRKPSVSQIMKSAEQFNNFRHVAGEETKQ